MDRWKTESRRGGDGAVSQKRIYGKTVFRIALCAAVAFCLQSLHTGVARAGIQERSLELGIQSTGAEDPSDGREETAATGNWAKTYDGKLHLSDIATAVASDTAGNVYVTGSSTTENLLDIVTIKYSPSGGILWTRTFNGSVSGNDVPTAIAVDKDGNAYIVGGTPNPDAAKGIDFLTLKYGPTGKLLWSRSYDGPNHHSDGAIAVAVDAKGNVYVTGTSDPSGLGNTDIVTLRYNSSGKLIWDKRYDGPTKLVDVPTSIALDTQGNVFIAGSSTGTKQTLADIVVIKYTPNGNNPWTTRFDSPAHVFDVARDIVINPTGDIFVTGEASQSTSQDAVTIKFNAAGKQQWVKYYDGAAKGYDGGKRIALGSNGDVIVGGDTDPGGYDLNYLVLKYSSAGKPLWVKQYDGPAHGLDQLHGLAVGPQDNIFVTGTSSDENSLGDIATVKFLSNGKKAWAKRYNGPAKDDDSATGIALGGTGVFVTGYTYSAETWENYVTIRYDQ